MGEEDRHRNQQGEPRDPAEENDGSNIKDSIQVGLLWLE
jgi:hypothetical protein